MLSDSSSHVAYHRDVRHVSSGEFSETLGRVLSCAAVMAVFIPAASSFLRRGIPDVLFTGDAAALEIRMLHAAAGTQLVGPYSRFEWSHPGPMFFYLALPVYEAFGRRGPALNLFVFLANVVFAVALVLTAHRLRGGLFALVLAALLAVYALVGIPFLLTNEWNPVFPVIPLALLSLLAMRIALQGPETIALPAFAFVASLIVQTHVGYAPEVFALSAVVIAARWRLDRDSSRSPRRGQMWIWLTTATVLMLCWMLPLYEAATADNGNLQRVVAFFASPHLTVHPWGTAVATVFDQMAVMPLALARTIGAPFDSPRWSLILALASAQLVALVAVLAASVRRRDTGVTIVASIVLVQVAAAIIAVRAIQGEILPYLVIWVSLIGFMSSLAVAAWLVPVLQQTVGPLRGGMLVASGALLLLGLAITKGVPPSPVFREPDASAERLARDVETYLGSTTINYPVIHIASRDTWPTVMGVVLHLHKRGIPISVEPDWLFMVGKPLAAKPGRHPGLLFGDRAFDAVARTRGDLTFVATSGSVYVYLEAG